MNRVAVVITDMSCADEGASKYENSVIAGTGLQFAEPLKFSEFHFIPFK